MKNWFPGHMKKAIQQINTFAPLVDLFVVVLDARAPLSSYNENLDKIASNKPRLFVLSKIDQADIPKLDLVHLNFRGENDAIVRVNLKQSSCSSKILNHINNLLEIKKKQDLKKGLSQPRCRVFVVGVPNTGKSTLINLLAKNSKAKTGKKPGLTRVHQWIHLPTIQLLDTPGILFPKMTSTLKSVKLALIGAFRTSILPQQELFYASYKLISEQYPEIIKKQGLKPSQIQSDIYSNLVTFTQKKHFYHGQKVLDLQKGVQHLNYIFQNLKGVTYD